jgi:hypothetical protein
MIGRRLAALGILALASPGVLQAQVGLVSGARRIALIARVEYRLPSGGGGIIPVSSPTETASRLWVRVETGHFEEVRPGLALVFGHVALYAAKGATLNRKSGMLFVITALTTVRKPAAGSRWLDPGLMLVAFAVGIPQRSDPRS